MCGLSGHWEHSAWAGTLVAASQMGRGGGVGRDCHLDQPGAGHWLGDRPLGPGVHILAERMPPCVTLGNSILGPLGLSFPVCKMGSLVLSLSTHWWF